MPQKKWRLLDVSSFAYVGESDTILTKWWDNLSEGKAVLHGVVDDWGNVVLCSEFRFVEGHLITIDGVGSICKSTVVPVGYPWLETND